MILITENLFDGTKVYEVVSTTFLPPEIVIERAAHVLYEKSDTSQVGITLQDVLTFPKEEQERLGFRATEISLSGKPATLSEPVKPRYSHEYLVKPLQAQEQEVSAYITGYLTALSQKGFLTVADQNQLGSICQTAQRWAHNFLQEHHANLSGYITSQLDTELTTNK